MCTWKKSGKEKDIWDTCKQTGRAYHEENISAQIHNIISKGRGNGFVNWESSYVYFILPYDMCISSSWIVNEVHTTNWVTCFCRNATNSEWPSCIVSEVMIVLSFSKQPLSLHWSNTSLIAGINGFSIQNDSWVTTMIAWKCKQNSMNFEWNNLPTKAWQVVGWL